MEDIVYMLDCMVDIYSMGGVVILLYLFFGMIVTGIGLAIDKPTEEQLKEGIGGEIILMIVFWPLCAGYLLVKK